MRGTRDAREGTSGPAEVVLAGWDRPSMRIASEWLVDRFPPSGGVWDLSAVTVVTQGGRAGRILEAMLVERAEAMGVGVAPPRRVSPGGVAGVFVERDGRPAPALVRRMAWVRALERAPADAVRAVAPGGIEGETHRHGIAAMLERVHAELCGAMVMFSDVPGLAEEVAGFAEADRWLGAAAIQRVYLDEVRAAGWVDEDASRVEAIRAGRVRAVATPVVLVGVVELPGVARAALEAGARDVTALVFAPESVRDRFDGWGHPTPWWGAQRDHVVAPENVRFGDDPADQASCVVECLAEIQARPTPAEVVIGTPDAGVVPALRRWMREMGATGRPAGGTSGAVTRPVRALEAAASACADGAWAPMAALVRHPDVVRWIDANVADAGEKGWLAELDAFHEERVPRSVRASAVEARGAGEALVGAVLDGVERLLGELATDVPRRMSAWANPIAAFVDAVFPARDDEDSGGDRVTDAAIWEVRSALEQLASLEGTPIDAEMDSASAIEMVAELAGRAAIPEEARDDAVDLVGWLELAADPARIVIVTGMNEGIVPGGTAHDPMIPDRVRGALGLADDQSRVARDSYLAALIAQQGREARFIAGRRSTEGDPLTPSRVVLRGDAAGLVERFASGVRDSARGARVRAALAPGGRDGFPVRPVDTGVRAVSSISVTAFRVYLASPYAFYLRHVAGMRTATDADVELTAGGFGGLVHAALQRFSTGPDKDATDGARVRRALVECLKESVGVVVGSHPSMATRVQVEIARARLERFAEAQAERRSAGWVIHDVEWEVHKDTAGEAPGLEVDGAVTGLRAKIDRVERHEESGQWAIIDFKTGSSGSDPERAHRKRTGEWVDLQLPLYAHVAARVVGDAAPRLGYGVVGSEERGGAFAFAGWGREDLDTALECARDVVRNVRAGEFRTLGRPWTSDPVEEALVRADRGDADGGVA